MKESTGLRPCTGPIAYSKLTQFFSYLLKETCLDNTDHAGSSSLLVKKNQYLRNIHKRMEPNDAIVWIAKKLLNRVYVVLKYNRLYEYRKAN